MADGLNPPAVVEKFGQGSASVAGKVNTRSTRHKTDEARQVELAFRVAIQGKTNHPKSGASQPEALYALMLTEYPVKTLNSPIEYPGGDGAAVYNFYISPQSISMSEPMAVTVQPTQDGGHFIENQGQLFKQIAIAGTTGFRPNKVEDSTFLGETISTSGLPAKRDKLPDNEFTGFQEFFRLRNLFRYYSDLKRDSDQAGRTVMIWINVKDGEAYIVEPLDFKTNRDSSSPFTFKYEIALQTIQFLDPKLLGGTTDRFTELEKLPKLGLLSQINNTVTNYTQAFEAASNTLLNKGLSVVGQVQILNSRIASAISNSLLTGSAALDVPRGVLSNYQRSLSEVKRSYEVLVLNPTIAGSGGNSNHYRDQLSVANAFSSQIRAMGQTLAIAEFTATNPISETFAKKRAEYEKLYFNRVTGSSAQGITDEVLFGDSNSFGQYTIRRDETLEDIAFKLFGNTQRMKELVILNKLKAPYISGVRRDGVLKYGDKLLYPSSATSSKDNLVRMNDDPLSDPNKSPIRRQLGVDVQLSQSGLTGLQDLDVEAGGDLKLIDDIDNLKQAMKLRLDIEKGQVRAHPEFGIISPVGQKNTPLAILNYTMSLRATLFTDDRVSDITNFSVEQPSANSAKVSLTVLIKGLSEQLDITRTVGT